MKDYLATHVFKSEEMKKKFHEVVGSTSAEDLKKGVNGEKAVCHMTMMCAGDSMNMYCKWQAESPQAIICLLYTSPSPRDRTRSRMPSSA